MQGDLEKSTYWARMSLRYAPNDLETLLLLSLINMDLRKYTVAMATLQRAIELAPDYGRAHYNLGYVYYKLGVLDLALENFLLAAKYKGDPNACLYAGYAYLARREYDEAFESFEESKRVGYFPFIALYFQGYIEKLRGNGESAQKYFRSAIDICDNFQSRDRDNPHFKVYRALALAGLGENQEAVTLLADLENTVPIDGDTLAGIARGYAILGNIEKAQEFLKKALTEHDGPSDKEIATDPHFEKIKLSH